MNKILSLDLVHASMCFTSVPKTKFIPLSLLMLQNVRDNTI